MNKQIIEQWINALRSGDYVQGVGTLKCDLDKTTRYCCLGVLAELIEPLAWEKTETGYKWGGAYYNTIRDDTWEEITDNLHFQSQYWRMNDEQKASFNEIADQIERDFLND